MPKAYPVYDAAYREHLAVVRAFVDGLENLQTIGRNGLHRYNNQDHAMLTGMLAVRNLLLGEQNDLWSVNTDQEYHEEIWMSPSAMLEAVEAVAARSSPRSTASRWGSLWASTTGAIVCLATLFLVVKGGATLGRTSALLGQYFPGYTVTPPGSLLGLAYGFAAGFAVGWTFAVFRNATLSCALRSYSAVPSSISCGAFWSSSRTRS